MQEIAKIDRRLPAIATDVMQAKKVPKSNTSCIVPEAGPCLTEKNPPRPPLQRGVKPPKSGRLDSIIGPRIPCGNAA
jgi:hypothetical protein